MLVDEVKSQEIFSLEYYHEVVIELNVQNVEDFFKLHRGYIPKLFSKHSSPSESFSLEKE